MAFKLGVAPALIKNNSFRYGTYKKTTLSGAASASATSININTTSPLASQLLAVGDSVILGTSTNSSNIGASEKITVSSVGAAGLIIYCTATPLVYNYASGDTVTFVGSRLAGSWNVSSEVLADITPVNITSSSIAKHGFNDNYAQTIKFSTDSATRNISQSLGNVLLNGAYYRAGLFYKKDTLTGQLNWDTDNNTSATHFNLRVSHDNSTHFIDLNFLNGSQAYPGSTFLEAISTPAAVPSAPTYCIVKLTYFSDDAGFNGITIDDIYLEHAISTDDASNGVWTFDDDPDYGSVNFFFTTPYETFDLANGNKIFYDPTGTARGVRKYECTAEFTNVNMTNWKNLLVLQHWQDRGNLLVFHPGGDYTVGTSPYIQETGENAPPVMYGRMELNPKNRDHWDLLNRCSFTFKFIEA
jgi:hypothetical protein